MNITKCICKNNDHSIIDRYQSVQCKTCLNYMHLICYDLPPYDERTKNFECILCRVQNCDPFSIISQILLRPFILPTNHQKIELNEYFQLTKNQVEDLQQEKIQLMIFCTKIKIQNEDDFPYEWPSDGLSVIYNGRLLPQYHIYYPFFVHVSQEDPLFHIGSNSLLIKIPKENKETIYAKSVFGVCLIMKKEIKDVAKELAKKNPLSLEDAKNKFESMKQKDIEILTSFPIRDPITIQLLFLPSRGMKCKHLSCFDLMNFLKFNAYNQTPLRWKCPICRKQVLMNELVIDLYLHKILKEIKSDLMARNYTEEDINKISYICFDEKGNWKPKQDFSDEWEKQNRKNDKSRIKTLKGKSTTSEHSNPNEIKQQQESIDFEHHAFSHPSNHIPEKEDVIIMNETLSASVDKSALVNENNNRLYAEEITVEHCVMIHKDLVKSNSKVELTSSDSVDKITMKLKEFNVFKNFSAKKFYEFLLQAEINLYITSFFDEGKNLLDDKEFEELCEEAVKSPSSEIVKYGLAWAISKENIVEIVYLVSTRNENQGLDIKFSLELLIIFAYLIYKRKISLNLNRKHLFIAFGELMNCFARKLSFKVIHFQKVFTLFSVVLPDLNFPFYVSKTRCYEFYENLSDFFVAFLSHLTLEEFQQVLIETHLPPYNPLEEIEDRRLARHFLYYFVLVLRKKENSLTIDRIYDVLAEWDINNQMRSFMHKERINLFNVSLEENELKNFSY